MKEETFDGFLAHVASLPPIPPAALRATTTKKPQAPGAATGSSTTSRGERAPLQQENALKVRTARGVPVSSLTSNPLILPRLPANYAENALIHSHPVGRSPAPSPQQSALGLAPNRPASAATRKPRKESDATDEDTVGSEEPRTPSGADGEPDAEEKSNQRKKKKSKKKKGSRLRKTRKGEDKSGDGATVVTTVGEYVANVSDPRILLPVPSSTVFFAIDRQMARQIAKRQRAMQQRMKQTSQSVD